MAPSTSGPGSEATKTSDGGEVTVVATWRGATAGTTFEVKLDTHSTDLDQLDLADAALRNDRGEVLNSTGWDASKGGHHRAGILSFAGNADQFLSGAKWIELVLRGIGDIPERILRWDIAA